MKTARLFPAAAAVCAALLTLVSPHAAADSPPPTPPKKTPKTAKAARAAREAPIKFDRTYGREQVAIKAALLPVVAEAARSTHRVFSAGAHTAFATAVHSDGWLITKASELATREPLEIECAGGLRLTATLRDRLDAYDLALLKVEATGLKPVSWSDQPAPTPGSFLAAPSALEGVAAVGVASVGPRNLYQPPKGYLGVQLRRHDSQAAIIDDVFDGGAAQHAGLKPDDIILAVDGAEVKDSPALVAEVSRRRPGDQINLKIRRGTDELTLPLTLMDRSEFMARLHESEDPMVLMSGRLSRHRRGFFNVFQHDLVLAPEECGGPLVDLEGRVVGLDIARSGRVESLAIPAADLKTLLTQVTTGKFTLPNLEALREELKKADLAILAAQETRTQAELALQRAHQLHATLPVQPSATAAANAAAQPAASTLPTPATLAPTEPSTPVQASEPEEGKP